METAITVTVDGRRLHARRGETILQLASRNGLDIPSLCHDHRVMDPSECGICVVRIDGIKDLQNACTTIVEAGMMITTCDDEISDVRGNVLRKILDRAGGHRHGDRSLFFTGSCSLCRYCREYGVEVPRVTSHSFEQEGLNHPFIDHDMEACIRCGRCVRICRQVAGVGALILEDRGEGTRLYPSAGKGLPDTMCESCGLCLACPTGALHVKDIPGSLDSCLQSEAICHYCSLGCAVSLLHTVDHIVMAGDRRGNVNDDGSICRFPRFASTYIDRMDRIREPMIREGNTWRTITFEQAYSIIADRVRSVDPAETAVFAGGRLSCQEQYLAGKLARFAIGTPYISSFLYLGGGEGYLPAAALSAPVETIRDASAVYLVGAQLNMNNAVAGYMACNGRETGRMTLDVITVIEFSSMDHKADTVTLALSYFHLARAMNHHIITHGLVNGPFIENRTSGYDEYRDQVLANSFDDLARISGVAPDRIKELAERFCREERSLLVFSEKEVSPVASRELVNLVLLTGKAGKPGSGIVSLKESCNGRGLFENGVFPSLLPGAVPLDSVKDEMRIARQWGMNGLPRPQAPLVDLVDGGMISNMIILGEDPMGCAVNGELVREWIEDVEFTVVQDIFMTETARMASLVLPGSLPWEVGGSYINTSGLKQCFNTVLTPGTRCSTIQQLQDLIGILVGGGPHSPAELADEMERVVHLEAVETIPFLPLRGRYSTRLFEYGCDNLILAFERYFNRVTI